MTLTAAEPREAASLEHWRAAQIRANRSPAKADRAGSAMLVAGLSLDWRRLDPEMWPAQLKDHEAHWEPRVVEQTRQPDRRLVGSTGWPIVAKIGQRQAPVARRRPRRPTKRAGWREAGDGQGSPRARRWKGVRQGKHHLLTAAQSRFQKRVGDLLRQKESPAARAGREKWPGADCLTAARQRLRRLRPACPIRRLDLKPVPVANDRGRGRSMKGEPQRRKAQPSRRGL